MPRLGWGLVLAGLVWLAGCASTPPASFYALSPLPEARDRQGSLTEGDLSLGIGPVTLPDFLDRPQLVDRSGANRLEVDEFQRWGGSLRADIVNILSENLAHLLGTSRVLILPAEVRVPVQYRLVADILRFEPGDDGHAHLKVRWAPSASPIPRGIETARWRPSVPALATSVARWRQPCLVSRVTTGWPRNYFISLQEVVRDQVRDPLRGCNEPLDIWVYSLAALLCPARGWARRRGCPGRRDRHRRRLCGACGGSGR